MQGASRSHSARPGSTIAFLLVCVLAGLMLVVAAQQAKVAGPRQPEDLAQLVRQRSDEVADLSAEVTALTKRSAELTEQAGIAVPQVDSDVQSTVDIAVASNEVTGPGLSVSLWDAPSDPMPAGAVPDDLVVHQQDLQAVVNALWAGGAEAMTIQGQRVTTLTAVRCVGNVLFLHGQVYSPPFVVEAIGDPDTLRSAVESDPTVRIYQEYVRAFGLGWSMAEKDQLDFPAANVAGLRWATAPDGTDPFA